MQREFLSKIPAAAGLAYPICARRGSGKFSREVDEQTLTEQVARFLVHEQVSRAISMAR